VAACDDGDIRPRGRASVFFVKHPIVRDARE
jgi:hypothetical protein